MERGTRLKLRALVTAAVAVSLLLIASTIKSGWLYLVASGLFSLIIAEAFLAWRGTRKVSIERDCPREVFEGERFKVTLKIRNRGRTARHLLAVRDLQFTQSGHHGFLDRFRERQAGVRRDLAGEGQDPGEEYSYGKTQRQVTVESLGPGETVSVTYEARADRRGVYEKARMAVRSGGVFGSVQIERPWKIDSPVTVFPRIFPLESFPMNPGPTVSPVESFEWSRKGMGQDYYGVREYIRGDSLRHIHWRSSAKRGCLIVKEYQQEFYPPAGLVVLLGQPRYGTGDVNSVEDGLRAAASIIDYFSVTGSVPGLIVPGKELFEFHEGGGVPGLLAVLADYRPPRAGGVLEAGGLEGILSFAGRSLMPGSAICVVANTAAVTMVQALAALSGLGGGSLVLVADESYAKGGEDWRPPGMQDGPVRGRGATLFLLTRGRGVSGCLNEPLSITG
ncbi:MAG: DUF58 domain-containing protein [Actinobacteria bacterium]|nr:DUF58 domain-containing protein [Actinomycetota bacterium]MBU4391971.1 DUF58 domain-containing protein [Actinomycetota bacterium]MBU4402361.1 DUF58 domain-containing protein [Actinomycetota bacterium]MBU4442327.1 DUF58 domain-containing protein [Actinomycetota bacterium]